MPANVNATRAEADRHRRQSRLQQAIAGVLRGGGPIRGLKPERDGWYLVVDLAQLVSAQLRGPVDPEEVEVALRSFRNKGVELSPGHFRLPAPHAPGPDILFHAIRSSRLPQIQRSGSLGDGSGAVHFARSEEHAWRVAHRQWDDPMVLYVDAARARREGIRFNRTRSGQYFTGRVPIRHVLNLRHGFAEQASAGGFLVDWRSGIPRLALIRVVRRSGATWEVAKGKLEPGETPDETAAREVQEEMGVGVPINVARSLGVVRYGFSTPDGAPRLKTIYLYLLETDQAVAQFVPASAEGIDAVRWFDLEEALAVITHPSLKGATGRLLAALKNRAEELNLEVSIPQGSARPD